MEAVKEEHGQETTVKAAQTVMKEDLGLRYRPLKRIAFRANSPKSLVQRKQYA